MNKLTCFISKFLDTDHLDQLAENNDLISPYYLGCYPADINPSNIHKHCCWIWNVDESDKSGAHWVVVVKNNKRIVFFNSYGKTTEFFKRNYWLTYFQKTLDCKILYYSHRQRQSHISRTCGAWCLLFLWEQWSDSKNILRNLNYDDEDLLKNEQQLQTLVYTLFPDIIKIYDAKRRKAKRQICKTFLEMHGDKL